MGKHEFFWRAEFLSDDGETFIANGVIEQEQDGYSAGALIVSIEDHMQFKYGCSPRASIDITCISRLA